MTRVDDDLDEYGKRELARLRSTPLLDSQVTKDEKVKFLLLGENLRQGMIPEYNGIIQKTVHRKLNALKGMYSLSMFKTLAVTILVVLFLAGSSITVNAAQSSLPGEPLYTIKSWSEDVRLSMTFSTKAKLDLTLDYTNQRMDEISRMVTGGRALNDRTSERFQSELDHALQLAAAMDDPHMQNALQQIKRRAENQGMTIEELIDTLPPQGEPAIMHLLERLQEQIQLSTIGESDPQAFRSQIHERLHTQRGPKHSPTSDQSESTPAGSTGFPMPGQGDDENGNGKNHSTEVPEHGIPGNGQGQSTPGNGNHGQKPTETQAP